MKQEKFDRVKNLLDSGRIKVDGNEGIVYVKNLQGKYKDVYKVPYIGYTPYATIFISIEGKLCSFTVHQIIMIAHGCDLVGKEVNHIDGDKQNNKFSNLEAVTRSKNMKHFYKMHYAKMME